MIDRKMITLDSIFTLFGNLYLYILLFMYVNNRSGHVPLLTSTSIDQKTGVLTPVCPQHVAIKLSEVIKPMKVIFLNDYGGLVGDYGKV